VPRSRRPVYFDAGDAVDTPVYWRPDLAAGTAMQGPAIIDQLDSTTVVPPGVQFEIDKWLNIIMRL
jgi:N-methylhydantoinase A